MSGLGKSRSDFLFVFVSLADSLSIYYMDYKYNLVPSDKIMIKSVTYD